MELETRYFGKIEIDKSEIILFPQGIPGFLEEKQYILLSLDNDSPFFVLQSTITPGLAFITMNPWDIIDDYEFVINESIEKLLQIKDHEDVLIQVIGNIKENLNDMTVNLSAPLVINYKKKLGKQVILDDTRYSVKCPVFPSEDRREAR